jgi:hypothetical protein
VAFSLMGNRDVAENLDRRGEVDSHPLLELSVHIGEIRHHEGARFQDERDVRRRKNAPASERRNPRNRRMVLLPAPLARVMVEA